MIGPNAEGLLFVSGMVAGGVIALAPRAVANRWRKLPSDAAPLSDADQGSIVDSLEVHTAAIESQVSTYADVLADGDPVLRARLRQFEAGEAW